MATPHHSLAAGAAALMAVLTLLSDFGLADPFVGVMKGAALRAAAGHALELIDLTHQIAPGNVVEASFWLAHSYRYFAPGSVHLAVVDPGVGSERRAVVLRADGQLFVGPDNGVLAEVAVRARVEVRALEAAALGLPRPSRTFHGRDLFAPAAARLATGRLDFDELPGLSGLAIASLVPRPEREAAAVMGQVVTVDRFGNLLTNLVASELFASLDAAFSLSIAGRELASFDFYAQVRPGELFALVNSFGVIEVAARDASAAAILGLGGGSAVCLRFGALV